ncbi:hypothetical protein lerEdw1_010852 [Lerista edwardsae]|nr:hypothetical protein lerEdw1_010852 [Lerista edwardsae]
MLCVFIRKIDLGVRVNNVTNWYLHGWIRFCPRMSVEGSIYKNKDHSFFTTDSEHPAGDFWRNIAGERIQETNSPHSLKKDVENMGKEELQKVLFEQIDLRRRLEQEFQVLKGTASFPVFNNFQDQMKRELAYREEMVQQLQIVRYSPPLQVLRFLFLKRRIFSKISETS